jgi:hypothetical protein
MILMLKKAVMRYHQKLNLGKMVLPRKVIKRNFLTSQKMTLTMKKMKSLCRKISLSELWILISHQSSKKDNLGTTSRLNKILNSNPLQEIVHQLLELLIRRGLLNRNRKKRKKLKESITK